MKLGSQTNSLVNHLYSRAVIGQPEPVVGMGATILCWTDRHPGTIVTVAKDRGLTFLAVREDIAIRVSGSTHDGSAQYRYEQNPTGHVAYFKQDQSGKWREVSLKINRHGKKIYVYNGGHGLRIGERAEYRDPSF